MHTDISGCIHFQWKKVCQKTSACLYESTEKDLRKNNLISKWPKTDSKSEAASPVKMAENKQPFRFISLLILWNVYGLPEKALNPCFVLCMLICVLKHMCAGTQSCKIALWLCIIKSLKVIKTRNVWSWQDSVVLVIGWFPFSTNLHVLCCMIFICVTHEIKYLLT